MRHISQHARHTWPGSGGWPASRISGRNVCPHDALTSWPLTSPPLISLHRWVSPSHSDATYQLTTPPTRSPPERGDQPAKPSRPAVPAHRVASVQPPGVLCTGRARPAVRAHHGGGRHRATAEHLVVPVALTCGECVLGDAMAAAVDSAGQRNQDRPRPVGRGSSAVGYARSDNLIRHWNSFTEGTDASASAGCGASTPQIHPPGPFTVPGEPESSTRQAIVAYPGIDG